MTWTQTSMNCKRYSFHWRCYWLLAPFWKVRLKGANGFHKEILSLVIDSWFVELELLVLYGSSFLLWKLYNLPLSVIYPLPISVCLWLCLHLFVFILMIPNLSSMSPQMNSLHMSHHLTITIQDRTLNTIIHVRCTFLLKNWLVWKIMSSHIVLKSILSL